MMGMSGAAAPSDPETAARRLLVVEDDADVAKSLAELLSHPRVAIALATNGVEAVARAKQLRPHVILLDVWLPVMDGFEVFRILHRDPELLSTRVIFISAFATEESMAHAKSLGAYAAYKKPFNEESLRRTIHGALDIQDGDGEPSEPPA